MRKSKPMFVGVVLSAMGSPLVQREILRIVARGARSRKAKRPKAKR